ncbi:MAG: hypothetical protein V1754_05980, partial [Pseudomonadota bacterium]
MKRVAGYVVKGIMVHMRKFTCKRCGETIEAESAPFVCPGCSSSAKQVFELGSETEQGSSKDGSL